MAYFSIFWFAKLYTFKEDILAEIWYDGFDCLIASI